ncbi:RAMP superfamily CRISPR-associated protein [Pseudoalteromonas rubra]|uniref:RAMP superfamily CRISPR-associated protein n=1 Tax=Pseudoalteromonas rubra TaxID=43658 RepID=UPI000F77BC9E|nr:RAMP superfamily CRISPR-associated protein [Pseudoalteromonas rubra]
MNHQLIFNLHSDWHIGSGEQGGSYADALAIKCPQGLPYIPGKSVKGLLREAFRVAAIHHWFDTQDNKELGEHLLHCLFGHEGTQAEFSQGALQLTNATLSAQEQCAIRQQPEFRQHLFRVINSTAIGQYGVAKNGSLRAMEVAVPMTLGAQIALNRQHGNYQRLLALLDNEQAIWTSLEKTLVLIQNLGAKRQRGFGEVSVSLTPEGV